MSYLLTQMFLYMLCTFLLGLLLGWLLWRYGSDNTAELDALRRERDTLKSERADLQTNLDACRTRGAKEREELEKLRATKSMASVAAPVAAVAAPVAAMAAPAASVGVRPEGLNGPRGGRADDLKRISGVGPKMENLMHDLGFYHFDQIAGWSAAEVAWVDENLEGFKGRVTRDNWIGQAKKLL